MWCIPKLTPEFRQRMEDVISLCLEPYDPKRPVICLDEKSKQLLADSRRTLPLLPEKQPCRTTSTSAKAHGIFSWLWNRRASSVSRMGRSAWKKFTAKNLPTLVGYGRHQLDKMRGISNLLSHMYQFVSLTALLDLLCKGDVQL